MLENESSPRLEEKDPLVHKKDYYDRMDDFKDLISSEAPLMMFEADISISILTVIGFESINLEYCTNSIVLSATFQGVSLTFEIMEQPPLDWLFSFTHTIKEFVHKIGNNSKK